MRKANSLIIMAAVVCCFPLLTPTSMKEADACPKGYKKILILASGTDSSVIARMEEYLTKRLQDVGYTAVSAIHQYGYNAFRNIREEEPLKQLYPYDAVMTVTLLNKGNQACCRTVSDSNKFFWEYYADIYARINTPEYYTEKGKYYWEADLFELCNWQLKYSMQTNLFEPALTQDLALDNGNHIIDVMIKNNIIEGKSLKPF
jgi:hypothetical protein